MEPSTDTLAPGLWHLVHDLKVPIRNAAARLRVPVSAAFELLAQERMRRDEAALRDRSALSVCLQLSARPHAPSDKGPAE
jgi:hypothetical protein